MTVNAPTIPEMKILSAPDKADEDYFGYSISDSGDIVVIGALYANSDVTDRGMAYGFSINPGGS